MFDDKFTLNNYLALCFRLTIAGFVSYALFIYLNGKHSGYILLIGLIVTYIIAFFVGRHYIQEGFQGTEKLSDTARGTEELIKQTDTQLDTTTKPYANTRIDSVDDYEYNMVFNNEIDRELKTELQNKLMSQYPLDWSTQPGSSIHFQQGLQEQQEQQEDNAPYDTSGGRVIYTEDNVQPPNTDTIEINERKMLKRYVPKNTSDLKTYDVDDAYGLIKKMYTAKGLVPEVTHKKDTNIYEITGVRKMGEKVQYEDEVDAPRSGGEESLTIVPQAAKDLLNEGDPFYNKQQKTRTDKWDYTKYTPELERMFAPTYPQSQWY